MTKTNNNLTLVLIIFLLVGTNQISGQRNFFVPHQGATPKFNQKNDLYFSIGGMKNNDYSPTSYTKTLQAQLGYSPFEHIGISIFHSRYSQFNTIFKADDQSQSIYGINVGFYLNQKRYANEKTRLMLFGLSTGYTFGQFENIFRPIPITMGSNKVVNLELQKFYMQGDIHYSFINYLWVGVIYRVGRINFYKGLFDGTSFGDSRSRVIHILSNPINTFSEIALKMELKHKGLGLYVQTTSGRAKKLSENFRIVDIGLTINLSEVYSFLKTKKDNNSDDQNTTN